MPFTTMLLIILFIITINSIDGMKVRMNEPTIKIYDNSNLTIVCKTELSPESPPDLSLSVRARMVLTFLTIPRSGQLHQVNGVLHCDPLRTKCESEFNIAVSCIRARINISLPIDTIESACQLVDDHICSHQWLQQHRGDCFALGRVTIIKGPKLGESCIFANSSIEQLLPCAEHQYCDTNYGICQCKQHYRPMNNTCIDYDHKSDSLNLLSSTTSSSTSSTQSPVMPTISEETQKKSNKSTSKALVIFLLIVAILLCIALAVVVIWSYSRNRNRLVAVGSD